MEYWRSPESCGRHIDAMLTGGDITRSSLARRGVSVDKPYSAIIDGHTMTIVFFEDGKFKLSCMNDDGSVEYSVDRSSFAIERIVHTDNYGWVRGRDDDLVGDEQTIPVKFSSNSYKCKNDSTVFL